ncbi:acyl-CoA N-acyltransferase [Bombardia bombarda]|uniref:Acyl-CoA N-acyltransferase n=1 Tax=Bombardia bombarda TaxID=252184 RepID=A0AA39TPM3_9PEZI|nr:acyl-CoA N-acyltransferase [Bombardia bombarda]
MPLQLRPATEGDFLTLGRISKRAFPHASGLLFPTHLRQGTSSPTNISDDDDEVRWRAARMLSRWKLGSPAYVVVDVSGGSGDPSNKEEVVVGFAQWQEPGVKDPLKARGGAPHLLPATLDQDLIADLMERLPSEEKKAMEGYETADMYYLLMLAVDPSHQRRGVGKMLLRHGIDQATAEGKKVYLTATPEGKPLYLSHGMKQTGEFDLFGISNYVMVYDKECS